MEHHRQGYDKEFQEILDRCEKSLQDSDVMAVYNKREDHIENMTKIFESLASKALSEYASMKNVVGSTDDELEACRKRIGHYLKKADNLISKAGDQQASKSSGSGEYTFLIKGFFDLLSGDLKSAESNFRSVQNAARTKKAFLFASYIGGGIVAYSKMKWQSSLESFAKALQENPGCGSSVRVAISACLFKLELYDKAQAAVDVAFAMDPRNVHCIVIMALLEQVLALKNRVKRFEHRARANDLWVMVHALDSNNASALIHMANFSFYTFADLGEGVLENSTTLHISSAAAKGVMVGDRILIKEGNVAAVSQTYGVKDVYSAEGMVVVVVDEAISSAEVGSPVSLKYKALGRVTDLANKVLECSAIANVKSEALYILGRTAHQQNDIKKAKEMYRSAIHEWQQMNLAIFGLAQILFSEKKYGNAKTLFEQIEKRNPGDNDTRAYIYLIDALEKKEVVPVDKVKEVALGFSYEIDLWLIQGALRQRKPEEFGAALKCYQSALDCAKGDAVKHSKVVPLICTNIAALQLHLGLANLALDSIKSSLIHIKDSAWGAAGAEENPTFKDGEFEGIFYSWSSDVVLEVKTGGASGEFTIAGGNGNAALPISVGDDVSIGDVIHSITAISSDSNSFSCYCPLDVFALPSSNGANTLPLRVKVNERNFNDKAITTCFNYARILEECGRTSAASELYIALAKAHPSFTDCYLRLSNISQNLGKKDQAKLWIDRAMIVNEASGDALVTLGDMYQRESSNKEAKKILEDLISHDKKDPRPMVAMGNLYHQMYQQSHDEKDLTLTYKYYHNVLQKDKANAYAAAGLGVYCAEKGEYEPARQMLARVREASMPLSEDISNDLAHLNLIQGRITEAEHLYLSNIKSVLQRQRRAPRGFITSTFEAMAMAQYKSGRHEEALRSLLRSLHQEPSASGGLRVWYNVAVVRAAFATSLMNKTGQKSVKSINNARAELSSAQHLFTYLSMQKVSSADKSKYFSTSSAGRHAKHCDKTIDSFENQLQSAEQEEALRREERKRQEEEHKGRMKVKEETERKAAEAVTAAKLEAQAKALKKREELEALRETWAVTATKDAEKTKARGPRKKKGEMGSLFDEISPMANALADDSDDDELTGGLLTSNKSTALTADKDADSDSDDSLFGSSSNKRKAVEDSSDQPKKPRIVDNDDDDKDNAMDVAPAAPSAAADSDEDLFGD